MLNKKKYAHSSQTDTDGQEKIMAENLDTPPSRQEAPLGQESLGELQEKQEDFKPEQLQQIREKIEKTEIDDSLNLQAASHAQSIKLLDEEKKIKKLLELAKSKGVVYAVNVAKKMDDAYVLDLIHDMLAKEGYYKKFIK